MSFNVSGDCKPALRYMADIADRLVNTKIIKVDHYGVAFFRKDCEVCAIFQGIVRR